MKILIWIILIFAIYLFLLNTFKEQINSYLFNVTPYEQLK